MLPWPTRRRQLSDLGPADSAEVIVIQMRKGAAGPAGDAGGVTVALPTLDQMDVARTRALVSSWVANERARRRSSGQDTVMLVFDAAFVVILVFMLVFVAHQILSDEDYGYPDDAVTDNKTMRRMHSLTNTLGLQPLHRAAGQHGGSTEEARGLLRPERDSVLPAVGESGESAGESDGDSAHVDADSEGDDDAVDSDDIEQPGRQVQGATDVVV